MSVEIITNIADAAAAINRIADGLNANLTGLIEEIMQKALVETQENMATRGHRFGHPWAPASKWIQAKKGDDYRILDGMERNLRVVGSGFEMQLIFISPGNWSIMQHNDGFRIPADGQIYDIAIKSPGPLSLPASATSFKFRWGKDSLVPARKIFMNEDDAREIIRPLIEKFKNDIETRITGGH